LNFDFDASAQAFRREVVAFLDQLTYGEASHPRLRATRDSWRDSLRESREGWRIVPGKRASGTGPGRTGR